jgi:hypothetical protein
MKQVITKCSAPGQLALAYDDGPYQYTQKLVDTLTAGGAKGTFFVTGKQQIHASRAGRMADINLLFRHFIRYDSRSPSSQDTC